MILGEAPYGINGSFGSPEKEFSAKFSEVMTKCCCFSLHYSGDNSYLFVNGQDVLKFKANDKNISFSPQICLGSISNGVSTLASREVSLGENIYDFSVNYGAIDKYDKMYFLKKSSIHDSTYSY